MVNLQSKSWSEKMTVLYLGLALFGGSHLFSVLLTAVRNRLSAWWGEARYKGIYSVLSLAGIVLMAVGYWQTRFDGVLAYAPFEGARHVTMLLVLVGFIAMATGKVKSHIRLWLQNPFSVGVALWSIGHLLANGKIAVVLIYATLLAIALLDIVSNMMRGQRPEFDPIWRDDIKAVIGGVIVYAVLVWGFHPYVLGVPVMR
jgi:uncharacterized membrane protein